MIADFLFSLKPALSLSSFIFIKKLFSSSSLSVIRVVSSAHLMLLMFLPPILIPACHSSSPAFLMMCSACRLNKQGDRRLSYSFLYLEPISCSIQDSNCFFLTCIQVSQDAGKVIWYSHFFKNFPQFIVIHTIKGFSIVKEAELYIFSGILLLFI